VWLGPGTDGNFPGMTMTYTGPVLDAPDARELADFQPQQQVRVCVDPAGHPFCLWVRETRQDLPDVRDHEVG
jgi:hypothetical protein